MRESQAAVRGHADGTLMELKVHPSSSRSGLGGMSGGRLSLYVHSPAEKGRANKEALKLLADALGLPASRLELMRGASSRHKTALVRGLSPEEVCSALELTSPLPGHGA